MEAGIARCIFENSLGGGGGGGGQKLRSKYMDRGKASIICYIDIILEKFQGGV